MSGDPAKVVRRYYDAFQRRDLDVLGDVIAPHFTGYAPAFGTFTCDEMRQAIAQEHAAMPEDETIVEEQIVSGDQVVTRWRYRWKHTASLYGEPTSDEWLEMEGVHIDRVVGEAIVYRWEIKDFMGVIRHLNATISVPSDATETLR